MTEEVCSSCLYKKNCQKLVKAHKNPIVGCTAYKNEADVVSKAAYEQVKWERDVAMEQLKDAGIPFGGKADVAVVKHGEWILDSTYTGKNKDIYVCSVCTHYQSFRKHHEPSMNPMSMRYCPSCGAKMDRGVNNEQ